MKACARKEVILSAGVFGSAQLLMLAGIGPKDHLEDVKIPVLQDSKVGYNLKDHYSFGNLFFIANDSITIRLDNYIKDAFHVLEYLFTRKGLLTVTGGFESLGFEDITGDDIPDIEVAFGGATMGALKPVIWAWGAKPETFNTVYKNFAHMEIFTIFPLLMHPKSSGRLMLKDKNPLHKPFLFHNYFTHPDDMETLIKGVRRSIELVDTHAFRKYGSKLFNKSLPACQKHEFNSDKYWECSARHLTFTIYHQCGTCKMGPDSDPDAVVHPSLRVRGINNLRVIDAYSNDRNKSHTGSSVYDCRERGIYD
ncbi:Glucose dehydrogenase [FAD, quinone] [Blattella germanica]|nr:Glucose dehydrogenase [FAD, quinone] [Blattella germanica]